MNLSWIRWSAVAAVAVVGVAASAQSPATMRPASPPATPAVAQPVTRAEWSRALVRAEQVLRTGLGLPARSGAIAQTDERPVGRRDIAEGLERLFAVARPEITFTPRRQPVDLAPLKPETDPTHRRRLETLLGWGLIAPVGPVTLGERDRFTVREVGDVLAFFFTRVAELTYTPTGKFTPYLMGDGSDDPAPVGRDRSR